MALGKAVREKIASLLTSMTTGKCSTILVSGVAGVGKTTLCQQAISINKNARHLLASIYVQDQPKLSFHDKQVHLALALRSEIDNSRASVILLDGHLILDHNVTPIDVVRILNPNALVTVYDNPEYILRRITSDKERVRCSVTAEQIAKAQELEITIAKQYSNELGITHQTIVSGDVDSFILFINKFSDIP